MSKSRAQTIADAWVDALNEKFGTEEAPTFAARSPKFAVSDSLPDRVTQAVDVVARADRGKVFSRGAWRHEIELVTLLRILPGKSVESFDDYDAQAEEIADFAKTNPLPDLDGYAVELQAAARTLWLPEELKNHGLYVSPISTTWAVEVPDPDTEEE